MGGFFLNMALLPARMILIGCFFKRENLFISKNGNRFRMFILCYPID
jgi:hypothetical protein